MRGAVLRSIDRPSVAVAGSAEHSRVRPRTPQKHCDSHAVKSQRIELPPSTQYRVLAKWLGHFHGGASRFKTRGGERAERGPTFSAPVASSGAQEASPACAILRSAVGTS
jgi:hypothetical protein